MYNNPIDPNTDTNTNPIPPASPGPQKTNVPPLVQVPEFPQGSTQNGNPLNSDRKITFENDSNANVDEKKPSRWETLFKKVSVVAFITLGGGCFALIPFAGGFGAVGLLIGVL